jgi:Pyruvate/2-oxoacid:ferredoxin oxidoreductase delta subunit
MTKEDEYERKREERIAIDKLKCIGCGSCVVACPNGGFKVVNGKSSLIKDNFCDGLGYCIENCPVKAIKYNGEVISDTSCLIKEEPRLKNWPIKLHLVNPKSKYFKDANIIIVADCVPLVLKNINNILKDKVVLIVCPKIETGKEIREKLMEIIEQNNIQSLQSYSIDYVCCDSLSNIVKDSIRFSSKKDQLMPNYKHHVVCLFGIQK